MESGAATSITAAEKIAPEDPNYSAHQAAHREAVLAVEIARGQFEAAKLRAAFSLETCCR